MLNSVEIYHHNVVKIAMDIYFSKMAFSAQHSENGIKSSAFLLETVL